MCARVRAGGHIHTRYISTCPGNTPVKPAGRIRGAERAESAHCSDKHRTHRQTETNTGQPSTSHGPRGQNKTTVKEFQAGRGADMLGGPL